MHQGSRDSVIQAKVEVSSTLLRLDTASLLFWNSCGQGKNSHLQVMMFTTSISLFEAGLVRKQMESTAKANQKKDKLKDTERMRTPSS